LDNLKNKITETADPAEGTPQDKSEDAARLSGDLPPEPGETPAGTDLPEGAPETAAGTPPKPSEAFRNRIKSAHPDQDFSDDETYFQKASEQLDNLEQYKNNNMEANKALMEIFDAEPAIAEVLKDMVQGASFREALSRHFSPDELTPQEGDPDMEGWKKNADARSKKLADNELANKTRAENEEFTTQEIKKFAEKNNISPDKAEEELSKIGEVLDEAYSGRISSNLLQTIYQGIKHDSDVETAMSTGQIAGRNEKIVAQKQEKPMGDGLPVIKGNDKAAEITKKKDWVTDLIDSEKKRQIL
jgi:hypothetical protein